MVSSVTSKVRRLRLLMPTSGVFSASARSSSSPSCTSTSTAMPSACATPPVRPSGIVQTGTRDQQDAVGAIARPRHLVGSTMKSLRSTGSEQAARACAQVGGRALEELRRSARSGRRRRRRSWRRSRPARSSRAARPARAGLLTSAITGAARRRSGAQRAGEVALAAMPVGLGGAATPPLRTRRRRQSPRA